MNRIIALGISWLAGILVASYIDAPISVWALAALASMVGWVLFNNRDERAAILLACLMALSAGAARFILSVPSSQPDHVSRFNDSPRNVIITGVVADEPDVRDRSINLRVETETLTIRTLDEPDGITSNVRGKILVSALRFPEIPYGARIEINGKLSTPFENYEFSYKDFLAQEEIYSTMFLPRIEIIEEDQANGFIAALLSFKREASETITRLLPSPQSAMLQAVLLGDDVNMPEGLKEDFRTAGLAHITVISGFHVALLTLAVVSLAQAFTTKRNAAIVTIVILILYMLLVGARPSVVRATIMGVAYLVGNFILGRRGFSLGILFVAAIMMTAINPQVLFSVSFQLSFAATLGVILFASPLDKWVRDKLSTIISAQWVKGVLGSLITIVIVSFSAQILTLPLVGYHFEKISTISLLSNALVLPAQPFLMIFGAIATILGMAIEPLGRAVALVDYVFLTFTVRSVEILARVPFASVPVRFTAYSAVIIYGLIGAVAWYFFQPVERRAVISERASKNFSQRFALGSSALAAVLVVGWGNSQPDGMLHVTFFDVGQGDAVFIETPSGRQILIDAGYFPSVINAHLGEAIPFWDRSIDMVVATHPDADHVSGLPGVFDRYSVEYIVTNGAAQGDSDIYDAFLEKAKEYEIPESNHIRPKVGSTIMLDDGVRLEVVHPTLDPIEDSRNENSVSFRLVYKDFSLMLTGDAEEEGEAAMVSSGVDLQSAVYKVGHHGSTTSTTPDFLAAVDPKIAVVSAGKDNKFGHPHCEVVERLEERDITVLSTINLGSIEVISDGATMWWEAHNPTGEEATCGP